MDNMRITNHPVLGELQKGKTISFTFDGKKYEGVEGDTIASALLANCIRTLRVHEETGTPRGIYCNIGHCFECRVTVNGKEGVRACITPLEEGMVIERGKRQLAPFKEKEFLSNFPRTYAEFEKKILGREGDDRNV